MGRHYGEMGGGSPSLSVSVSHFPLFHCLNTLTHTHTHSHTLTHTHTHSHTSPERSRAARSENRVTREDRAPSDSDTRSRTCTSLRAARSFNSLLCVCVCVCLRVCVRVLQRGETALHMAARAGQSNVVRYLVQNGARVDAKAKVT